MRVFKIKPFARFARSEGIADRTLRQAIERAETGLIDANLGGGVIKQRVARPGKGRSGGYRTVIAYRSAHRAVFAYGFAKNERDNIGPAELARWRQFAAQVLNWNDDQVEKMLASDAWQEVKSDEEDG